MDHQIVLQSAELELQYIQAKHVAETIYQEEQARVLRVNLLLSEGAADDLQEQLDAQADKLFNSECFSKDLQTRLDELSEQFQASQDQLKACMRDIDQYQAELNALQTTANENNKTLHEKLALSRELNSLRPELDHLRSLVTSHENVLADKLSLQRELAATQLEIENEKRTVERLKAKQQTAPDPAVQEELEETQKELNEAKKKLSRLEKQNTKLTNSKSAADAARVDELASIKQELESAKERAQKAEDDLKMAQSEPKTDETQIDALKADLAKEKKAVSRAQREALKKQTEWDTQKETLEGKLDAFRTKLRSTKEQLKEAQDELERHEQAKYAQSTAATKARLNGKAKPEDNPKKRNVARFDPDMTIGTPGNGGPVKKARLVGSLGDKSTFSITPFLNKTLSILPESPGQVINDTINEIAAEAEEAEKASKSKQQDRAMSKEPVLPKPKPAERAKSVEPVKQPLKERPNTVKAPALDSVVEEEQEGTEAQEALPKKKKLLGARKNIFDDNEPDGIKKASKDGLGKVKLGLGRKGPKLLAEFSPLKKERRSVSVAPSMIA